MAVITSSEKLASVFAKAYCQRGSKFYKGLVPNYWGIEKYLRWLRKSEMNKPGS